MANYQASEYQTMFAAHAHGEIRIVLAGKTGEGKSALGNVILAKEEFIAKRSMKSETSVCLAGERHFDGRRLIVVDTPGLFDTNADPKLVAREIGKAVRMSSPGPHCFIVTISARNRFTEEAQQTINLLSEIFGGNVLDYCIVVFTNEDAITDEGMKLKKWLLEQIKEVPALADLMKKCGCRYMAFNSKSKSTSQLDRKMRRLLSMIDRMVAKNNGRVYTNDMYKQAEAAARKREEEQLRETAEKEAKVERQMEELRSETSMLKAQTDRLNAEKDRRKAEEHRRKAEEHRRKAEEDRRKAEEEEKSHRSRQQWEIMEPHGTIFHRRQIPTITTIPELPRERRIPFPGESDETCTIS